MNKSNIFIILITSMLFLFSIKYDITDIIISALSFLILMEAVRAIIEYMTNKEHRIHIRYIFDGAILFGIRELFVGWLMIKTDTVLGIIIMVSSLITIGVVLLFRYISMKQSPKAIEK